MQRITDQVNETLDRRSIQKKTFFNDGWTILSVLVSYLTYNTFGSRSLVQLGLMYGLVEFVVKVSVDLTCWFLSKSGLTQSFILNKEGKLVRSLHSMIAASLVLVYLVLCTAIFTIFFVMVALDVKKLQ
jgi:hypothetical protein